MARGVIVTTLAACALTATTACSGGGVGDPLAGAEPTRVTSAPVTDPSSPSTAVATSGAPTTSPTVVFSDDPMVDVVNATRDFAACLSERGTEFIGPPDPTLSGDAPQNQPGYLAVLGTCASRSSIVEALTRAERDQPSLTVAEIELQNFGYLAWRDCVAAKGEAVPPAEADERGSFVRFSSTGAGDPLTGLDTLVGCMEAAGERRRSSSCDEDLADGRRQRWSLEYTATVRGGALQLAGLATTAPPGEWTFSVGPEDGDVVTATPDGSGRFDVVLPTRQALARPPGRGCALVLNALGASGVAGVALLGDSNMVGIDRELAGWDDVSAQVRAWDVIGQSGGTWLSEPAIAGSGPLDELRGIVAQRPSVVVVGLGVNDALVWGLARLTGHAEAFRLATGEGVRGGLDLLRDVPCVVLTGATEAPTTILTAGHHYRRAAADLNDYLSWVVKSHPNAVVTDWAEVSAGHHLADGSAGDWFDDDGIHLNSAGRRAYVDHVTTAVGAHCAPGAMQPV